MPHPDTLERLARARIVPVVTLDDVDRAPDLIAALFAGGIRCAEITLRTESGLPSIASVAGTPGFTVGAGTVLTPEQVDASVDAGAEFIVSPGYDPDVVERAQQRGVTVIPGIATPGEVQRALRADLHELKLFPADLLGGLAMISALAGPFPSVRFMPSGGVTRENAVDYLRHPAIFAVSGSWMVSRNDIAAGRFDDIERMSADAIGTVTTGALA